MTNEERIQILNAVDVLNQDCSTGASWIPLAKLLAEAKDRGEDLSFTGLKNNVGRLISAYRFLEIRRPELLENPSEITGEYRAIACLPTLYGRLPAEERDSRIEDLLDKVIEKQIPTYIIERYATTLTDESKKLLDSYVTSAHLQRIEGALMPTSEEVLKAVEVYKGGGHWIPLAKVMAVAKDRGEDLSTIGFSSSQIGRMITAYRYLEVIKPEILSEPEKVTASITALAMLPHLASKAPPEIVEDCLDKLLDNVLTEKRMVAICAQYEKVRRSVGRVYEDKTNLNSKEMKDQWVMEFMHFISITVDDLIQSYGYENLRKSHSKICDDLATKFRCIADPGYKKQWDERKEGIL